MMILNQLLDKVSIISGLRERERKRAAGMFAAGVCVTLVVGAGLTVAYLFATKSGKVVRGGIADKSVNGAKAVRDAVVKQAETVKSALSDTAENVSDVFENVQEKIQDIKKDIKEGGRDLAADVAETTEDIKNDLR